MTGEWSPDGFSGWPVGPNRSEQQTVTCSGCPEQIRPVWVDKDGSVVWLDSHGGAVHMLSKRDESPVRAASHTP